jgi:hypothetical protein
MDLKSPIEVGKFHNLQITRKNRHFTVNLQISTVPYFIQGTDSKNTFSQSFVAHHNNLTAALTMLLNQLRT